jgi:hypothetical protein
MTVLWGRPPIAEQGVSHDYGFLLLLDRLSSYLADAAAMLTIGYGRSETITRRPGVDLLGRWEVRGSGKFGLGLEVGDSLAQYVESALERLLPVRFLPPRPRLLHRDRVRVAA